MEVKRVGIVDYGRSPMSKAKGGALNDLTGLEIAAQVVHKLLERNPRIPQEEIESLVAGCAFPEAENGMNFGRCLVIKAGLPISVAGITVNHFCASSMQAVMMIANALALGQGEIGIAVGMEHMKRVPLGGFNPFYDKELKEREYYTSMGQTAENLARELNISREDQETFAGESHRKALRAWADNAFAQEVIPIVLPDGSIARQDETPREPDLAKMKSLPPVFEAQGTVTAATCSPVTSGVAAAILITEEKARALGIPLKARLVSSGMAGCDYKRMGMGPLPATEKALRRAGLTLAQLDVIELNEAFAAQSLYVIRQGGWNEKKINLLGGAIALGHPLGMSGVRIIGTGLTALERVKGKYALATLCVGGGQGAATIWERS